MFLGLFFLYNNCIASSAWTESQTWPCVSYPYCPQPEEILLKQWHHSHWGQILVTSLQEEGREENKWECLRSTSSIDKTQINRYIIHTQWEALLNKVRFVKLQIPINQWQFLFESLLMQANILPWKNQPDCTKIPATTALSESPVL